MVAVQLFSGPLDDSSRAALVFAGELLVFQRSAASEAFRQHVAGLVREVFGDVDPVTAHQVLDRPDLVEAVASAQRQVRADETARQLFRDVLGAVGVDVSGAYWDWIYLRVLPPGSDAASGRTAPIGFHRDTWSSNLYAQTNWWMPIHPITAERSLAFYPAYWSRPLANSSAAWDLDEVRARRRDGDGEAPLVPVPTEDVDVSGEVRLVPGPGDVLCFSGAHLHASVPNTTEATRFSVEVRTIDAADLAAGRGAPNVDGAAPRVPTHWFHHVLDGRTLTAEAAR